MERATGADAAGDTDRGAAPSRVALWVLVVQCLLALSWTLYVLFLPGLLAEAGIAKRFFVYVLIADQLLFAACDWFAGVYADRVAHVWRRLGRVVTATTLLSSAALLAMPWIAQAGSPALLLAIIFAWAATSSALRAPVFALLGRIRSQHDGSSLAAPGAVSLALVGIALAGAIGPYVTLLLKNVQPQLPIAVSAIALAVAGLWALRAERALPRVADDGAADARTSATFRRRAWSLAVVVLVASFGTQVVTAIVAQPMLARYVGTSAVVWSGWFWAGFALGLAPGARLAASRAPLAGAAGALLFACAAFAGAHAASGIATVTTALAASGAGWGAFTAIAFATAVALSRGRATARGAGTAAGLLFSALAVGNLLRLGLVAAGWTKADVVSWLPAIAWFAASVLLVAASATVWRRAHDAAPA